jgi:hypothetical protein
MNIGWWHALSMGIRATLTSVGMAPRRRAEVPAFSCVLAAAVSRSLTTDWRGIVLMQPSFGVATTAEAT